MTDVAIVVRHADDSITIHPREWDEDTGSIDTHDLLEDGATITVMRDGKPIDIDAITEPVDTPKGQPTKHKLMGFKHKRPRAKR